MTVTPPDHTPRPAAPIRPAQPLALYAAAGIAVLAILAAVVTTVVYGLRPSGPDLKDPKSAIPACREQVKARMRAPATTQFPGGEAVGENSGQPQIDGVYDSQNGFGALVRGSYTCLLSHDDKGNVQVASVTVEE